MVLSRISRTCIQTVPAQTKLCEISGIYVCVYIYIRSTVLSVIYIYRYAHFAGTV